MTHLTDEQILSLPLNELADALHRALIAVADGEVTCPPRNEQLGTGNDPDVLHLEMSAAHGTLTCTKVIEEKGGRDQWGNRAPGERNALVTLREDGREVLTADGGALTDLRTGLAAVLGARYLVPERSLDVGLVGTGKIALQAARAADSLLDVRQLSFTSRSPENRAAFEEKLAAALSCTVREAESIEGCVEGCEVVIAAVPAEEPVIFADSVAEAKHVALVAGDPRVVMGDSDLFLRRWTFSDHPEQVNTTGDIRRAAEQGWKDRILWAHGDADFATLAQVAAGRFHYMWNWPTTMIHTGNAALDLAVMSYARQNL